MTADPITTFLRDSEALLQQYAADVNEIVSLLLGDTQCPSAGSDYLITRGAIAETGIGCAIDQEAVGAFSEFCASNAGKKFRVVYEIVEEPRNTERPPPMEPSDSPVELLRIGRECVAWSKGTGACHLCEPVVPGAHEPGCPVGDYMLATTSHGRVAPPPMFSPTEPDTFAPVTNVSGDSDELTATRGGRMVPRYDTPEQLRWSAADFAAVIDELEKS